MKIMKSAYKTFFLFMLKSRPHTPLPPAGGETEENRGMSDAEEDLHDVFQVETIHHQFLLFFFFCPVFPSILPR